jgi:hypothetical protein
MANTSAICTSFKVELLSGIHALGTSVVRAGTSADVIKGAIFLASGSLGAATTAYSVTSEIANTGTYAAGGATITNATAPASSGTTAFWTPSATIAFTGVTFVAADTLLLYNSTQGSKAIAVFNFGSQTITSGNFSLSMPTNDATTGLLRMS